MSEERGSAESQEILRNMWNEFAGSKEEPPVAEGRSVLIEQEIQACRDAREKIRSIMYKALMTDTKSALKQGCFKAFSVLDYTYPIGRGFHGGNEAATFEPEYVKEGA